MTNFENITILGAGQMGSGIGLVGAKYDFNITFYDIEQKFIDSGLESNKKYLDRQVTKDRMDKEEADQIFDNMSGELDLETAVQNADLVIEAVVEDIDIKKDVWSDVGKFAPEHTLFGSNTSSLSITEMAKASGRPDQFLGTHFFNPPVRLKLIELIRGYETSDETIDRVISFADQMEMTTVEAEEAPGFIVNRLLLPQLNEAYYALQEGIASKEDIDTAMKLGLNHKMGPLTLSDFIGLDTILYIAEYMHEELGEKFRPCPLLRKMVRAGKLGRKSGEGFYVYD